MSLTFKQFNETNAARNRECYAQCENWSIADWMMAIGGEVGEAMNVAKKYVRDGQPPGHAREAAVARISEELADVLIYIDLLVDHIGGDLEAALVQKFNEVSERRLGTHHRLPTFDADVRVSGGSDEERTP